VGIDFCKTTLKTLCVRLGRHTWFPKPDTLATEGGPPDHVLPGALGAIFCPGALGAIFLGAICVLASEEAFLEPLIEVFLEPLLGGAEFPAKGFPPKFPEKTGFPGAAEAARRMRPRGCRGSSFINFLFITLRCKAET